MVITMEVMRIFSHSRRRLTCRNLPTLWATALIGVACLLTAKAQPTPAPAPAKEPTTATNAPAKLKFNRPATGAPSVRLTGGSRGAADSLVTLEVLAPNDVGLTTQEQPCLFWYQSKPSKAKFELTVLEENNVKPVVRITSDSSAKAGIQRVRIADHGAKLAAGVEYQWVVALITDSENRSSDLIASGVIKRIDPTADLKASIAAAAPESLAQIYAGAGIWYDALSAISDQIDAQPGNAVLLETRADLLRQGGLKGAVTTPLPAN